MTKRRTRVASRLHLCSKCRGDILPGQEYLLVGRKKVHDSPDCEHAEPVEAIFPWWLREDPLWRLFQPLQWRCVRTFRVELARKEYDCWHCQHSRSVHQQMLSRIYAGDRYDGAVWVSKVRWEIRRYHDTCPWDPTEDKDFEAQDTGPDEKAQAA